MSKLCIKIYLLWGFFLIIILNLGSQLYSYDYQRLPDYKRMPFSTGREKFLLEEFVKNDYYWGEIDEMHVITKDTISGGIVVALRETKVKEDKLLVRESGASGGFGVFIMDLVKGDITVLNRSGKKIIHVEDKKDYIEAVESMIGIIERQIEREKESENIEKLESVKNYLLNILDQLKSSYY